ncbi:2-dehydropantoate 2-reductase [Leptolyngbya sp. 'hensonii']|uniref:putative 2-dehydropantoate 2-reductase n=1 Tax=Leptolyngbya sp. 'hensonii' TaxID=1922337 RepID=UPI00094F716F|nr:putative 2-dehydropantoate 2-reductase [Leptolyngbya sp. 'hensonii']OLP20254.1 2-dehydropantoate 2-reductase [Leptolyngbya sp. 'hensonii']
MPFELKSDRRYAILGTGALGGFYGARLQKAGAEVHFLLHRDYDHVAQRGLVIESPDGDFTLPIVHAYSDVSKLPPCDVVVVALKTTQNHLLPDLLPSIVQPEGVVLVLQNGLGIEPAVARIVGADRVIGGLCFLCSNKVGPGHIRHLDYSEIKLGEYGPDYSPVGISQRMRQIAEDFERAGIPMKLAEDLLLARWQKLVWNIPFNGLSVILNARTDELMADPDTRLLAEQLMQEVAAGALSEGRVISQGFIQQMLDHTAKMKPYHTSMKLDYDRHHPLEIDMMFGYPLSRVQAAGTELPKIAVLYQQLKFLNQRNLHPREQADGTQ